MNRAQRIYRLSGLPKSPRSRLGRSVSSAVTVDDLQRLSCLHQPTAKDLQANAAVFAQRVSHAFALNLVEVAAGRTGFVVTKYRAADAKCPSFQRLGSDAVDDEVAPVAAMGQVRPAAAPGKFKVVATDQGHLAGLNRLPETGVLTITIALQTSACHRLNGINGDHRLAGGGGDVDGL